MAERKGFELSILLRITEDVCGNTYFSTFRSSRFRGLLRTPADSHCRKSSRNKTRCISIASVLLSVATCDRMSALSAAALLYPCLVSFQLGTLLCWDFYVVTIILARRTQSYWRRLESEACCFHPICGTAAERIQNRRDHLPILRSLGEEGPGSERY